MRFRVLLFLRGTSDDNRYGCFDLKVYMGKVSSIPTGCKFKLSC